MSIQSSVYLFFKKKYTYKGIHRLFKGLNLTDFSLSPIEKSRYYNEIDLRHYEGRLAFTVDEEQIIFDVVVEEYEGKKGTNVIELQFSNKGGYRATHDYVHDFDNSDDFISKFKKLKDIEGLAFVSEDCNTPNQNCYEAFKKGEFDLFLHQLTEPFSDAFHFDALQRYLSANTSMTEDNIKIFMNEYKESHLKRIQEDPSV
jgi:hypothetical protein